MIENQAQAVNKQDLLFIDEDQVESSFNFRKDQALMLAKAKRLLKEAKDFQNTRQGLNFSNNV